MSDDSSLCVTPSVHDGRLDASWPQHPGVEAAKQTGIAMASQSRAGRATNEVALTLRYLLQEGVTRVNGRQH